MKREILRRRKRFDARIAAGAEATPLEQTQYIAIHPFADDVDLLAELSWSADRCLAVDAYWLVLGDVIFIQVASTEEEPQRSIGRYGRWDSNNQQVVLRLIVGCNTITRSVFEDELKALLVHGTIGRVLSRGKELGATLKRF